jgi:hypothetical protein
MLILCGSPHDRDGRAYDSTPGSGRKTGPSAVRRSSSLRLPPRARRGRDVVKKDPLLSENALLILYDARSLKRSGAYLHKRVGNGKGM